MANVKSVVDEWEVRDLEDNSKISVLVEHNTEIGNNNLPGLQIWCAGNIVTYEPHVAERWAYEARKAGLEEYFLEGPSWIYYEDTFIKHTFLPGVQPKAKIEVKVRSKSKPIVKEYELPFSLDED